MKLSGHLFLSALVIIFGSCSLIYDEPEICAPAPNTITEISFVYDYNMHNTDLFSEHAGAAYLYVFDNDGIYRYRREMLKSQMTGSQDFTIRFDTAEIKPGKTYQFVGVAQGNHSGYEASVETPGFTLLNEMIPGKSTIADYILKLDRDDDGTFDFGVVDYKDELGNTQQMIDTLWTTKPDEVQIAEIPEFKFVPTIEKQPDNLVTITIPMMRITNSITVNLVNSAFGADTSVDDYLILIDFPNGNGTIDFTGNTLPAQELIYKALRKTVIPYEKKNNGDRYKTTISRAEESAYAIQSVFGVSRLQVTDGSSLQIRDAHTNEIIARIDDFSDFLADYFEHGFDDNQEFLDREYDFEVDVEIDNDGNLIWIQAGVELLGWGKRIYSYDLK